jgi:hypothetical protein
MILLESLPPSLPLASPDVQAEDNAEEQRPIFFLCYWGVVTGVAAIAIAVAVNDATLTDIGGNLEQIAQELVVALRC